MLSKSIQLYKNAFSGLNRNVWLLSTVMLVNRCGTMVLAFMTLYCKSIGFTLMQGGTVVAVYGAGSIAGALIGGRVSDKYGFYHVQFVALFFGGILFIVLSLMETFVSICVVSFILAMVNESYRPANSAAIAHYSKPENRTKSYSLARLAVNLGFGIGIAIGGMLASIDYKYIFYVDGCTSIVAGFCLLWLLPKVTVTMQRQPLDDGEIISEYTSPLKDKPFMLFLIFQFLFSICFFQLFTTIPVFFKEILKMSEFSIGAVMALNGILIALFEMVIVFKLEGRKPYLLLMSYGSMIMAASFFTLLLPIQWGITLAIIATLIITISEMVAMPFMNTYYISRTTLANRGRYAGLYTMTWSLSQMLGSITGTATAETLGYGGLWIVVAIVAATAGAGYYALNKASLKIDMQ